jgi:hypothetical protein
MTPPKNKLRVFFAALLLSGLMAGAALAAGETSKQGGIGGTGSPALSGGIGGTGAPANNSGIGGTGAPAGKVLFIVGRVEAQNQGQTRLLARGEDVRAGDTLVSDAAATLQLRMRDGGTIMLRPQSRLAIEAFDYRGAQDDKARMALALESGGFRAVTGEIGHLHKENVSIRTPNATVAIMGTDHETVFVPVPPPGQTASVAPGTYDHVYTGATLLQSDKGRLLIEPSQTGFMAINGAGPTLLSSPVPIFGSARLNAAGDRHADNGGGATGSQSDAKDTGVPNSTPGTEHSSSGSDAGSSSASPSGQAQDGGAQNSNGAAQRTDLGSKAAGGAVPVANTEQQQYPSNSNWNNVGQGANTAPGSGAGSGSNDPTQNTQNKVTQPDNLANTQVDLNALENDGVPAPPGSAVVGAHLANGLHTVGTAQSGRAGDQILVEDDVPGTYSNHTTGFNYVASEGGEPIQPGTATVDGVAVNWGLYAGGVAFDNSGRAIAISFHPYAYASAPPSVITALGGSATFSTVVGNTPPVTESGNVGGSVNLNVGVNLGNATLTGYNLAVTDAGSRNWTGTLNGAVPLATFAQSGAALAATCSGTGCGAGAGSGLAAGMLIGPNAKGLITSYALGTPTGQAVVGAAIMSRP